MKKSILYTIGAIGAIAAGWSAAITVNVNPTTSNPEKVKHNYCKPGSTKTSSGNIYTCSGNGKWVRTSTPKAKTPSIKVKQPKVHINY